MKAVLCTAFTDAEDLSIGEIEEPPSPRPRGRAAST